MKGSTLLFGSDISQDLQQPKADALAKKKTFFN